MIKKRILVIDDEPNVRLVFRTALESAGFLVTEAEDGEQGLKRLRRSPTDLVLLDLQMPDLGGMEVLRRIRGEKNPVPVVIITAHGSIPDAVAAMRLGAIDFPAKPITPDALRKVVAEVIERHAGERPGAPPRAGHGADRSPFAECLRQAKWALNRSEFEAAESFLRKTLVLDEPSSEVHDLWATLQKCRDRQEEESYRSVSELCG